MEHPLVSIIVPIYNMEKYLKDCIESIISQTYKRLEIILVDDGSTDNSSIICDEFKIKDNRIKVIHKENGGRNAARLDGINSATGGWIMFVDADDVLSNLAVSTLINNSDGFDLVKGNILLYDKEMNCRGPIPQNLIRECQGDKIDFTIKNLTGKLYCCIFGCIIKKCILSPKVFDIPREIYISEDLLINIRLGSIISNYKVINTVIYKYRYYDENTVRSNNPSIEYYDKLDDLIINSHHSIEWEDSLRIALLDYRLSILRNALNLGYDITNSRIFREVKKSRIRNTNIEGNKKILFYILRTNNMSLIRFTWFIYQKLSQFIYKMLKRK